MIANVHVDHPGCPKNSNNCWDVRVASPSKIWYVSGSRVFFASFPEEENLDYLAHGPIIQVLTVVHSRAP